MSDRFNEEFLEEINQLYNKYNVDAEDIRNAFSTQIRNETHEKIIETSKSNSDLVGRCFYYRVKPHSMFPEMKRYLKVVSIQSTNEYCVECLCFDEHPTYWFNYKASKIGNAGDYYLGSFNFDSIWTKDVIASSIRRFKEITLDEYNEAMRKYTEELITTPWYAEHYRYGKKMPTDSDWPKKDPRKE